MPNVTGPSVWASSSTFWAIFVAGLPFSPAPSTFSAFFVAGLPFSPAPSTFSAFFVAEGRKRGSGVGNYC